MLSNRRWRWYVALTGALLVAAAAGPRPAVDATVRPRPLAVDLDQYLASAEAGFPGLRPEAKRSIVWHDAGSRTVTRHAVVLLHGFSASAPETAPLAERVAAALGANLYRARLTGHGIDGAALGRAQANDWLNDSDEALRIGRRIGARVVLIGVSTGGTLATWLATRAGEAGPDALVLISPHFGAVDPREALLRLPWAEYLVPRVVPEHGFEPINAAHARHWTTRYPSSALIALTALVDYVRARPLEEIRVPTLTFHARADRIVDVDRMLAAHARIGRSTGGPKFLVEVTASDDPQQHVLAGDILSPSTTELVAARIVAFTLSLP